MFPGAVVGPCYQSSSASQVRPGFGGVVRPAGAGMTGPGRQTFSEGPSRVSNGSGRFCRAQNINSNEETPLELPPLVARPLVRGGEFLNPPPPTRIFKPNRSPDFAFPPPPHNPAKDSLSVKWKNKGRISPTTELPSPAGEVYPSSSPILCYPATSPGHLYNNPVSPSFYHHKPSSPNLSYFSKPSTNSRQRTLIEIQRHDSGPQTVSKPTGSSGSSRPEPIQIYSRLSAREKLGIELPPAKTMPRKLSVSESRLDPNCRPFTPSARYPPSDSVSGGGGSIPDSYPYQFEYYAGLGRSSYDDYLSQPCSAYSAPKDHLSQPCSAYSAPKDYTARMAPLGSAAKDVGLLHHSTSWKVPEPDHQNSRQDHLNSCEDQLDFDLEMDPLPEDPTTLLPDLESTLDEDVNNNSCTVQNRNLVNHSQEKTREKSKSSRCLGKGDGEAPEQEGSKAPEGGSEAPEGESEAPSEGVSVARRKSNPDNEANLPTLVPHSDWRSGQLRPPLLPTPLNFPPFGPSKLESLPGIAGDSGTGANGRETEHTRLLVSGVEQSLKSYLKKQATAVQLNQTAERHKRRLLIQNGQSGGKDSRPPSTLAGSIFSQDLSVPSEYLMSNLIGSRIRPINIRQEHTDLLFFLFYSLSGDALQLVAASLLFERGWRFHKKECIWLARWPGVKPEEKNTLYEKGLYQYFDVGTWKRIPGWFRLDYCNLSEKIKVPEDLKTLYTRYTGMMSDVFSLCGRNLALNGFKSEVAEEFDQIPGINLMTCIR